MTGKLEKKAKKVDVKNVIGQRLLDTTKFCAYFPYSSKRELDYTCFPY